MMEFEGHSFEDVRGLTEALRASWPGVWVEPRDGSDPMPLSWALRFGELEPSWRERVAAACAALLLDPDDSIAFAALDALRAAPWDVGPAVAEWASTRVDALVARRSPRREQRNGLAEVVTLLLASPQKDAIPDALSEALAARTAPEDGAPETALLALAAGTAKTRAVAAERLVDALDAASDPSALTGQILALGEPATEPLMRALRLRDAALATQIGDVIKRQLELAAANVELGIHNPDYPDAVRARLKAARGTHTKRWSALAAQLGVPPGKFEA